MISNTGSRFIIEDPNAIESDNFINQIFTTTTINNAKSSEALGKDLVDNYEAIQSKKPVKILESVKGVSGKEYELDRHDLREVLQSLFDEESDIYAVLVGAVDAIDAAEMAALNAMITANKYLDKITGAMCNLIGLLLGLTLALPLIRLLDALLGLILLAATKCQYLIYGLIMDKIDSDTLKKVLSIKLIHGALDFKSNDLLTAVLTDPNNADLADEANWLPGLIASTVTVDDRNTSDGKKEFVPLPYPDWYNDLERGMVNIDSTYSIPPSGSVDENGDAYDVTTSGDRWELSPLKYSPAYIAFARQHRKSVSVGQEPKKLTRTEAGTMRAIAFKENPDKTVIY